jgi:DNA-binding NarL/FixJ family response regulator
MNTAIKIVLADDHEIFREGLQMLLQTIGSVALLGVAQDGNSLIKLVENTKPDVILTDIKMPNMNGIEATKYLAKHFPETGIIALSMYDDAEQIIEFIEAGGKGYLLKDASKQELAEAIENVFHNKNYYCSRATQKISEFIISKKIGTTSDKINFKEIELQIINLICKGFTSKDIGEKIFLSPRTIEGYRTKIQEKMEVKNTAGIIIYAIKNGLIVGE